MGGCGPTPSTIERSSRTGPRRAEDDPSETLGLATIIGPFLIETGRLTSHQLFR